MPERVEPHRTAAITPSDSELCGQAPSVCCCLTLLSWSRANSFNKSRIYLDSHGPLQKRDGYDEPVRTFQFDQKSFQSTQWTEIDPHAIASLKKWPRLTWKAGSD